MKTEDMTKYFAKLFKQTTDQLIAREILTKGEDAAAKLGFTYNQYKNIRTERTPITIEDFQRFQKAVKQLDPNYIYKWLQDQLFPDK